MARTTITIDDDLLVELKVRAARTGRTLSAVVAESLERSLRPETAPAADRAELPVWRHGTGLMPGVEIASLGKMLGMLDQMEIDEARRESREPRFR
jgi:plasmid stability protein